MSNSQFLLALQRVGFSQRTRLLATPCSPMQLKAKHLVGGSKFKKTGSTK